jgi:hypothetical protein
MSVKYKIIICVFLVFLIPSGFTIKKINYTDARLTNVCKSLKEETLLFLIFVDSKGTYPWTEYDIQSTLDSLHVAVRWLEKQASINGIQLNVKTDYFIGEKYTTIDRNLPEKSVKESVNNPNLKKGLENLNYWADRVAREAGESLPSIEKEGFPDMKKPRDKERLVAYLRDKHKVESIALLYMVNNYFKEDISIPVNTFHTKDVEFAVVSYKYPSVIAHNFLHLFGAADLYETPYSHSKKRINFAQNHLPNDIMHDPYGKNIEMLNISEYSKYLIGWIDTLDTKFDVLLKDQLVIDF